MATLDDARELALALPATTERPSYGTPGFRVKDKLFARSREDDVLVVWVADLGEKEMLVRSEPDKFFTVPHYDGHASVLVRLSAVDRRGAPRAAHRRLADPGAEAARRRARSLTWTAARSSARRCALATSIFRRAQARTSASRTISSASATSRTAPWSALRHCPTEPSSGLGRRTGSSIWGASPARTEAGSATAMSVGLRHVRRATWLDRAFREDEVPAAVAATFARGGRNLQRTHDDAAERLTAELWATGAPPRR